MKSIVTAALLASLAINATPRAQEQAAADPLKTEEGLRHTLDLYGDLYEKACGALAEALWKDKTAGPAPDDLAAARAGLLSVYSDPELSRVISHWAIRRTVTRDPLLTERVAVWGGTTALAAIELDPEIGTLSDKLSRRLATHGYLLDGERVNRDELRLILRFSEDRDERRKAWLAIATAGKMLKPDVTRAVRMRAVRVRELRVRNYPHLMYNANSLDPVWIQKALSVISRTTKGAYQDLLERMRQALRLEELAVWDLDHGLEVLARARGADAVERKAFPPGRTVEVVEALLRTLGLDPRQIGLRAAQGRIPTDYLELFVHIPDDLRLVTLRSLPRGFARGEEGYETLARAYTRAAMAAYNRQTAPMLKGYDCLPATRNTAWSEGLAETIAMFLRDPLFLKKHLELTDDEIDILRQTIRDRELLRDRRLLLDVAMDYILYTNPDADLDARYRKVFRTSLLIETDDTDPTPWPADPSFFSGPPLHHIGLQSRAIAGDLHRTIREQFGDKRLDPDTIGPWLTEKVLGPGERMLLLERLTQIVKGGYDLRNYYAQLDVTQAAY